MKIISWNCNGKFREKYKFIEKEEADIYVIQECENPEKYQNEFKVFYGNYKWCGENENKGLGVFWKSGVEVTDNQWSAYCLRHFTSLKINGKYDLLGVWACAPYIEEYYIYQSINMKNYSENTIIIGDFNSNAIWDKKHRGRNHSTVVDELRNINIVSAYHYLKKESHGEEATPTFYLYRHTDKPYHIDYCFLNPKHLEKFKILDETDWLKFSDHLPVSVEVK